MTLLNSEHKRGDFGWITAGTYKGHFVTYLSADIKNRDYIWIHTQEKHYTLRARVLRSAFESH